MIRKRKWEIRYIFICILKKYPYY